MKKSSRKISLSVLLVVAPVVIGSTTPQTLLAAPTQVRTSSFATFDKRARAGERLNVVFFGASLTWGANASDPLETSYRALIANNLETKYPLARFKFHDAAIGGTGSQLGVFRLQRDVLSKKPDLVFLDFSANDDIYSATKESLASYESLVRRVITEGKCPLIQVIFPFEWNIKTGEMAKMKRRDAHLAIAKAYGVPVGDAIDLINRRVNDGLNIKTIWPIDGVHPGDSGYKLFAEAAWEAFQDGVVNKRTPQPPKQMLNAPTYMTWKRTRISQLGPLPKGWSVGQPNRVAAYFDFLMSRWLDDEVIASNRSINNNTNAQHGTFQQVDRLKVYFRGQSVMLLGESTQKTAQYRVYIDGKLVERVQNNTLLTEFNPASFAKAIGGNGHHAQVIATGLATDVRHLLEIEPAFVTDTPQELRLESICVAGGAATVSSVHSK